MANDQFNAGVFGAGAAVGIGAMVGSMVAGIQNAAYEIDEIVQEHHEQRDLKEFFDELRSNYAKAQKMIDEQGRMIDALTAMIDLLQGQLAKTQRRLIRRSC